MTIKRGLVVISLYEREIKESGLFVVQMLTNAIINRLFCNKQLQRQRLLNIYAGQTIFYSIKSFSQN